MTSHPRLVSHFNDTGIGESGVTIVFNNLGTSNVTTTENAKLQLVLCKNELVDF